MKLCMYCVYDKMTGYMVPAYHQNDGQAIRAFDVDVNSIDDSVLSHFSQDFNLQKVGEFDTDTGVISPCNPIIIVDGGSLKRKE